MYHYKMCGLPNVFLANGYEIKETPYGEAVAIQDVEGLHRAIAKVLVENEKDFSGAEVRFLRKLLDMSQSSLGQVLGVSDQQVANYEKEKKPVSQSSDKLLRVLVEQHIGGNKTLIELVERINRIDREFAENGLCFQKEKDWDFSQTC